MGWLFGDDNFFAPPPAPSVPPVLPILILSFTNHALDQFLEGIECKGVDLSDIVRVGSRTNSEAIASHSLFGLDREVKGSRPAEQHTYVIRQEIPTLENAM
jgi:hypothetical protein